MPGPHPAIALTRLAVRRALARVFADTDDAAQRRVVVGVSGGADSLALAAALAFEAPKRGVDVHAVVVDHQLQDGSAQVAERARQQCRALGLEARVVSVEVSPSADGPEAAARAARHAALRAVADDVDAARIALGHTGDDQAEQVLLGLLRGSGTRSLAGMRLDRDGLLRPFLADPQSVPGAPVLRVHTQAACDALGIEPWHDPHNDDRSYRRVQARQLLALVSEQLDAPTLAVSLARSAQSAARDADFLDAETERTLRQLSGAPDPREWPATWSATSLSGLDPAIRIRALRRLLVLHGARDSELASRHLLEVESLLVNWHGQGPIHVPGEIQVRRGGGQLLIEPLTRENGPDTSHRALSDRLEAGSGRQPYGK